MTKYTNICIFFDIKNDDEEIRGFIKKQRGNEL